MTQGVVIVGAGFAGTMTALALRDVGYSGRIRLVGEEAAPPYRRSSMTSSLQGLTHPEQVAAPQEYERAGIELMLDTHVTGCRPGELETDAGALRAEQVVLATGAAPRTASLRPQPQVHALASIEDGRWLKNDLVAAKRVLLVGAGLVNLQLASVLVAETAAEVVMVDPHPRPLERALGRGAGEVVRAAMESAGVGVSTTGARTVVPVMRTAMAVLSDGRRVPVDAVVVGVGTDARADLARACGAEVGDGVRCDRSGRTTVPGLWAVGASAEWDYGPLGRHRLSSELAAMLQARRLAESVMGLAHDVSLVPGRVVELFGMRVEVTGVVGQGNAEASADASPGFEWHELRNDRVTASISLTLPPRGGWSPGRRQQRAAPGGADDRVGAEGHPSPL